MIPLLHVYTQLGSDPNAPVGRCHFELRRGRLSCSFSYESSYLMRPDAYAIDPSLPLRSSSHHVDGMPNVLRDSAPDRWGRHLIARDFRASMQDNSGFRSLDEVDYLLGVHDGARQGALRFKDSGDGDFLSPEGQVPPVIELKRLLAASNDVLRGSEGAQQIKELLDAGSGSLGGARPKASVVDEGHLLLAKFPHPGDEWNVMAWEKTSLDLAAAIGIPTPKARLVTIGGSSVLLLSRFDRLGSEYDGLRIPYLSGMSLTGLTDGMQCDYADVAEALAIWSARPEADLLDLFTRIVLSVALHNTDDHLRNLGLIRLSNGWRLSPAFDLNINPDGKRGRVTSIYGETGADESRALRGLAPYCGISGEQAATVIRRVLAAMQQIEALAKRNGCTERECGLMLPVVRDRCDALATCCSQFG